MQMQRHPSTVREKEVTAMIRIALLPLIATLVASALPLAGGCAATPAAPAVTAAAERRVHTPAGELAVREAGRGTTTLLLWHSLYADPSMFDPLVEQLAPDYRLLLVSAPGHGNSGPPLTPLTSAASGAALLSVLDAYGVERAAVVGCSWGGIAGLQAALQAPRRITAVAAFNTPFGPGTTDLGTRSIVWMTGWLGNTGFFGRRVASSFFSQRTQARQPEVVERFAASFESRDPRTLQMVSRAVLMERESLLPLLPRLEVPVLVVSGAEDARYPAAQAEEIARSIPKARFASVADSAHLTPLEQPALSARLVRELAPPQQ
jgi:3-oxoadipate enol-lactonase